MSAIIIDGKAQAQALCDALLTKIQDLKAKNILPALRVILVGDDPASQIYVRNKEKKSASLGIDGQIIRLPANTTQADVIALINEFNDDENVHGILVQLPLPKHMDERAVVGSILPQKDVDGFHINNAGMLFAGYPYVVPCTPLGILSLIKSTGCTLSGAHAVVIGRSMIVGKPVSMLLQMENCTVTMCHSRTRDLEGMCRQADILVSAVGVPNLVRAGMVKPGAIVIDVGMNRLDGKLCGDVAFDEVANVAGFLTPVPGGVGPMTIAMLMQNTVQAAQRTVS